MVVIRICRLLLLLFMLAIQLSGIARAAEFPGWRTMRVIEQQGRPVILRRGDLDGDGREELIVVNTRHSRLDIYRWLPADERQPPDPPEKDRPNDLPMAPDFKHSEIHLENLPQDVVARDLDGDGQTELIILVTPPNKILVYSLTEGEHNDQPQWQRQKSFDLLPGDFAPRHHPLLMHQLDNDSYELLIGFSEGIQRLRLAPGSRVEWLLPREQQGRANWWLADIDGDGDRDLVEQSRESKHSIRWFETSPSGDLRPAITLHDRAVSSATVIDHAAGASQLLVLDGSAKGLLRQFQLVKTERSPLGKRQPLAIPGGRKAVWCGVKLGEQAVLVVTDPERPRMLTYSRDAEGWKFLQAYPAIGNVRAIAAPGALPGTLLLWQKDAANLQVSRWEDGRLSYPKPWFPFVKSKDSDEPNPKDKNHKILALASVGAITWWVEKTDSDLLLSIWKPDQSEPEVVRFEGAGTKVNEVAWLGGSRLMMKETHARTSKLLVLENNETKISQPAHIKKIPLGEFRLIPVGDSVRTARLTDGVLQWLDDDLRPTDQIMLPQGRKLVSYVADNSDHDGADQGLAIQADGQAIHRLEMGEAGIATVTWSKKIPEGELLVRDPVLGLMLVDHHRVTSLEEGQQRELKLLGIIDDRVGQQYGIKKTSIHRIKHADLDGDGYDEVLLLDDMRHRITALRLKKSGEQENDPDGESLQPMIAWPVFEDKKYPYGYDEDSAVGEPRSIVVADLDGDGGRDLAMLCHDRLVLYLTKE